MACILKFPGESKGIIVFTTIEHNRVYEPNQHADLLKSLKDNWVIGLHYNGPKEVHPNIYDFAVTGLNFVENLNGAPLVNVDAGKLAPPCFKSDGREKHWDVLYVGRCTRRKNVEFFFNVIKKLFTEGHEYRVLLVVTVPEDKRERVPTNPTEMYLNLFTKEERNRFTYLPLYHDSPFPFDRETLAEFYKSSRVYVHPSDAESGRARNIGYAWASEMPVVGLNMYHPDLEKGGLREPPYYYEAEDYDEIPKKVVSAVKTHRRESPDLSAARKMFSVTHSTESLKSDLEMVFRELDEPFSDEGFFFDNLDIRIARHHGMDRANKNRFQCSFREFLKQLRDPDKMRRVVTSEDPEVDIAEELFGRSTRISTEVIEEDDVTLLTPASERTPRIVSLLKSSGLYSPARKIHDNSRLLKRFYRYFYY
jgi:glycosyltransferase involved in cell wall biosynthesis